MRKSFLSYHFILPLMWVNILFGSLTTRPDLLTIARIAYWMILINILHLLVLNASILRFPRLAHGCFFGMISLKLISSIGFGPAYSIYLVFSTLVFSIIGFLFFVNEPTLLKRQITCFVVASIPVMFLQITGKFEILHYFNTLYNREISPGYYARPHITMLPLFLNDYQSLMDAGYWVPFRRFLSNQYRVPGLLYSNAVLGPIVLIAVICRLSELQRRLRLNVTDYLVVVAIVLAGSKLAFYGFIMILLYFYYYSSKDMRRIIFKLFFILAIFLGIYSIIFPALAGLVFRVESSFVGRIFDFLHFFGEDLANSNFVQSFGLLKNASDRLYNYGVVGYQESSGMVTLFFCAPIALVVWIAAGPFYRKQIERIKKNNPAATMFIKLSLLWAIIVLLATPLATAPFYGFFLGIGFAPFLLRNLDK